MNSSKPNFLLSLIVALILVGNVGQPPGFAQDQVQFSGEFKIKKGTRQGILSLRADIDPLWHVFSITQQPKGPVKSDIKVAESNQFKLIGSFVPDQEPHVINSPEFDVPIEEHEGTVTWSAPIELAKGVSPDGLTIPMIYNGQTCESRPGGSCMPLSKIDVTADFAGYDESLVINAFLHEPLEHPFFEMDGLHVRTKVRMVRAAGVDSPILPGDEVLLEITAESTEDFHVYAYSLSKMDYLPTIVGFTESNGWIVTGPALSEQPEEGDSFGAKAYWHHHPITWQFRVKIPEDAGEKTYPFAGVVGMQACNEGGCDLPAGVAFNGEIAVGKVAEVAFELSKTSYGVAKKAVKSGAATFVEGSEITVVESVPEVEEAAVEHVVVEDTPELIAEMAKLYDVEQKIKYLSYHEMDQNPIGSGGTSTSGNTSLWTAMLLMFLGGMLLNLMPCVFPVLGLKVMGFVMQSGNDPAKIRLHGMAFAFGLIVSMWVLGGIFLGLRDGLGYSINWGAQMGNPYFVGAMIILLFLLGLNMAGVFEIGESLSSIEGGKQEGLSGSFFSGVLTTLIATPCSGPFLGVAMSYTLSQPTVIAMMLFTIFALGIAFPYLVLSFYPKLIGMLPKPGPWMETFKVLMAFALFATVAFFLKVFGGQTGVEGLSWLAMALVIIGLAAYCYGNWGSPEVKSHNKRFVFGYAMPMLILGAGLWMYYDAAGERPVEIASNSQRDGLNWQSWNPGKIEYSLANNKRIIWVDYTADW